MGSDSQSSVSPAEELRWLEYQQRLRKRRRGVLADATPSRTWALGFGVTPRSTVRSAIGQPAERSRWAAARTGWCWMPGILRWWAPRADTALDHLLFAGGDAAIRDVMVAGRWVVKDRRHAAEDAVLARRFARLLQRLGAGADKIG